MWGQPPPAVGRPRCIGPQRSAQMPAEGGVRWHSGAPSPGRAVAIKR